MSSGECGRPEKDYDKACMLMWEQSAPSMQEVSDLKERTKQYATFCLGWKAALMADYCIRLADRKLDHKRTVEDIVHSFMAAGKRLGEAPDV